MVTTTFHMINGRVRNFSSHLARLIKAVPATVDYERKIRERLRAAAPDVYPWVSVEDHTFNVEIRPFRPTPSELSIDVHGHLDERAHPVIKGRDFAWQARALAASWRQGANEGLLVDDHGMAVSAIEASLLVIEGDMVFYSTHPRTLSSVIEVQVVEYLATVGAAPKARPDGFNIDELRSAEVWLLDSCSGVRRVSAWVEYGNTFPVAEVRPVATFIPTIAEVNSYLWEIAEEV